MTPRKRTVAEKAATRAKISSTSAMRPGPYSPQAISPSLGPMICTPSSCNRFKLRCVAGCCHMRTFIEGAIITGVSVAKSRVVARSSAMPCAILAIICAVAGATKTRSAARDSSIWPIWASSVRSNSSVKTLERARAAIERGVTNCAPDCVKTGVTRAPCAVNLRINSGSFTAAMPPEMIKRMCFSFMVYSYAARPRSARSGTGKKIIEKMRLPPGPELPAPGAFS